MGASNAETDDTRDDAGSQAHLGIKYVRKMQVRRTVHERERWNRKGTKRKIGGTKGRCPVVDLRGFFVRALRAESWHPPSPHITL